ADWLRLVCSCVRPPPSSPDAPDTSPVPTAPSVPSVPSGAYPEFRVFGVMLEKEKHHGPTQEARDP
ncbi:hypothetical protein, partial [Gluconacetobacter asukensis]|uniref:hypothetical protein n=1 Tax=Gluconacetobacter asukensis TaxID=1017181 RepID=UPI0031E5348B